MRVSEIRVIVLLLSIVQCLCVCPLPPSGSTSCSDINPPYNNPNIQTYAEVRGRSDIAAQYSALQSPLLRIDHVTCFKINAAVVLPSVLSVYFGEEVNNSCTAISEMSTSVANILSKVVNIRPATGKIFFRAKSGGSANAYARLYNVSLITGRCEDPLCSFDTTYNERACDFWEWNGWTVVRMTLAAIGVPGNVSALGPGLTAGTLKTDLLMATGTQSVCLQFHYRMTGFNDTLAVSVQHEDGCTELLWKVTNHNESSSWAYATAPLRSHNAFFITFQGQRCHTQQSKEIAIDDVKVVRPSSCDYLPQGSKPSGQQLTSTLDPSCDLQPGTSTSATTACADTHMPGTTTAAQITERDTSRTTSADIHIPETTAYVQVTKRETSITTSPDSDQPTPMSHDNSAKDYDPVPVIVGVIAGVVVLAVVGVVLAVVIWRKRKRNRSGSKQDKLNPTYGSEDGGIYNMEPSRETAAAPDIPSATETYYDGLGELSPQSHYTSLVGTESASEAAASYYNIDNSTQRGRHGPLRTPPAETPYENLGEQSPPSVYTWLQNTAAASDTGTYYSNDFAQDNRSHYNVTPGNSAFYNVVKDPQDVET